MFPRYDIFNYVDAPWCPLSLSVRNLYNPCLERCRYCCLQNLNGYKRHSLKVSVSGSISPEDFKSRLEQWEKVNGKGERFYHKKRSFLSHKRVIKYVGTEGLGNQERSHKYLLTLLRFCYKNNYSLFIKTKNPVAVDSEYVKLLRATQSVVCQSFSTFDSALAKYYEPGAAPLEKRVKIFDRLVRSEVKTVLAIQPLIPEVSFKSLEKYKSLFQGTSYFLTNIVHGKISDFFKDRKVLTRPGLKFVQTDKSLKKSYLIKIYSKLKSIINPKFFSVYVSSPVADMFNDSKWCCHIDRFFDL